MKNRCILTAVLALLAGHAALAAQPNIVVVLLDDMGYSDFGCYGGEARTPNIDALAENGLRFRNFYNTARCSPTRAALMTGNYSHQVADKPDHQLPNLRPDNNITLAELLRAQGYRTYMAGKWHLGTSKEQLPWSRGFQHVFGFGSGGAANSADYWDAKDYRLTSENNEIAIRSYGNKPYGFYQSDALADYGIDFINHHIGKGDDAPFFLYLTPRAPHFDLGAPKETVETAPPGGQSYLDIYRQGWDAVHRQRYDRMREMGVIDARFRMAPFGDTRNGKEYLPVPEWETLPAERREDLARRMAIYTAMVDRVDAAVGRIVTRLRQTGLLDNTLIFILSDNGSSSEGGTFGSSAFGNDPLTGARLENMGQPQANDRLRLGGGWANVANTPFRLYKKFNHEGGIRTPLVVHWPAGIKNPGRWTDQSGHVIDIMGTVVDAVGAKFPASHNGHPVLPLEGKSLVPAFNGGEPFARKIGFEHESNRAWIDGRWKMVTKNFALLDGSVAAHEPELYDLQNDPTELDNRAASQPEKLAAMVAAWNQWAARVGLSPSRLLGAGSGGALNDPSDDGRFAWTDAVDASGGWTLAGGSGGFAPRDPEIPPTAGDGYFCFTVSPGSSRPYANRAAAKDLGVTLQAGKTYAVMADFNQALAKRPFIADAFAGAVSESVAFGFFDPSGIDLSQNTNAERLKIRDAINAVLLSAGGSVVWEGRTPPGGKGWETWRYSFTVAPDSPFAGRKVWFGIYGGHVGDGVQKSLAFDHLRIAVSGN